MKASGAVVYYQACLILIENDRISVHDPFRAIYARHSAGPDKWHFNAATVFGPEKNGVDLRQLALKPYLLSCSQFFHSSRMCSRLLRRLVTFLALFISDGFCACSKKDGPYCETLLTKIHKTVSVSTKCSQWVAMLDATYFVSEFSLPADKRTMTRDYCPVSCNYCNPVPATSTSRKPSTPQPTIPATIPLTSPPTTAKPEEMLKEILEKDVDFRRLTKEYDIEKDAQDALIRYQLFAKNKKKVTEHNALFEAGMSSYKMAVNQFSVAKPDELAPLALSLPPPTPISDVHLDLNRRKRQAQNDTVDHRQYMQPIANQLNCGGCWAFAMNAAVEGFFAMNGHDIPALSVQQLLDCDRAVDAGYGVANAGCNGGYFQIAATYMQQKGITSSSQYPFRGEASIFCQLTSPAIIPRMKSFDTGYVSVENDTSYALLDAAMEQRVRKGPVAVGMAVNFNIYSYSEGIFDGACGPNINHAVVIVGFTPQYWIIRNSWGPSWGENGHIRILRQPTDPCQLIRYWAQPTEIGTWPEGSWSGNAVVVPPVDFTTTAEPSPEDSDENECCECCECEDDDDEECFIFEEDSSSECNETTEDVEETSFTAAVPITPLESSENTKKSKKPSKNHRSRESQEREH
ncbi:hypothetical protein Y032_0065g3632 [Ancylostoma ceylanicum]|nr:hypothetical protein Y032_0065g3632 [Ancylostoma ceylanicum]